MITPIIKSNNRSWGQLDGKESELIPFGQAEISMSVGHPELNKMVLYFRLKIYGDMKEKLGLWEPPPPKNQG